MKQRKSAWRIVFWLIVVGVIAKLWLLWTGAVLLASVTRWYWWLMVVVAILLLVQLYRLIFQSAITVRSFITYWIVWVVVMLLIGYFFKGGTWTGVWNWSKSTTAPGKIASVGTTRDGRTLVACQSNPNMPVEGAPAGVQAKIVSTPYALSPDGTTALYNVDSTEFAVSQMSLAKINGADKTVYTAADLPEGDVFFRVWGTTGFATGKGFSLQVCSTAGKMLPREELATPPALRTAADSSTTSAITMYMWRNNRVWEAGTYQAYGYFADPSGWHLIAKSPVFTITN